MSKIDKRLCYLLVILSPTCFFAAAGAAVDQNPGWALFYFGSGLFNCWWVWVGIRRKNDPCIPAEWASDEILNENVVVGDIRPAGWQMEEVMKARLKACLKQMWNPLNLERKVERVNDVEYLEGYQDGQLNGYALAVRELARTFDIDLEKS